MIIYFHGFASNSNSLKVKSLQESFGPDNVWAPDLPLDGSEVKTLVDNYLTNLSPSPVIFVGTSLGGFYANYFGQRYSCKTIMINPAPNPAVQLQKSLGTNTNFNTGETFQLNQSHLDQWQAMQEELEEESKGWLVNIFLALDDDVVDPVYTAENFPSHARLRVFEDGGHRFEKHWPAVIAVLKGMHLV